MSLDLTEDKSTLVQVMAWCCQATSHYLSQSRPRSLSPYGITRPQWVNSYDYWNICGRGIMPCFWCVKRWLRRWVLRANRRRHNTQLNFRSPWCTVRTCCMRLSWRVNSFPQWGQENDRSAYNRKQTRQAHCRHCLRHLVAIAGTTILVPSHHCKVTPTHLKIRYL